MNFETGMTCDELDSVLDGGLIWLKSVLYPSDAPGILRVLGGALFALVGVTYLMVAIILWGAINCLVWLLATPEEWDEWQGKA